MTPLFKICKVGKCGITISGYSEYLPEDSKIYSKTTGYAFSESITLNALVYISSDDTTKVVETGVNEHYFTENDIPVPDDFTTTIAKDGLYEVVHIILPTKDWYDTNQTNVDLDFHTVYLYDEGLKKVYNGELIDVTPEEIVEANPKGTTILKGTKNTFSLCNLQECYINISKDLLKKLCPIGNCSEDAEAAKTRDLVWMALNIIRYNIELGNYYEALRVLEWITKCGTLCSNYINGEYTGNGCGCNS